MARREMWFGTRGSMRWIPACRPELDTSKVGWSSEGQQLNGGATVRRSVASHRVYSLEWPPNTRDALSPIQDFADGVYGQGPIFFHTPDALDRNVLPQHVAVPAQGAYGAPLLCGEDDPVLSPTPSNTLDYPSETATYMVSDPGTAVYIPIPPDCTAWVGAHGADGTGGTVTATPVTGASDSGTPVTLTLLAVTDTTRFNYSTSAGDGLLLRLAGTGTVSLTGVMVQVLPTGQTPATGGFLSGRGHAGCSFAGSGPTFSLYNLAGAIDRVAVTARLTEVWD